MKYSLANLFKNRRNRFSSFWLKVVETRFVLCFVVFLSSLFNPAISISRLFTITAIYIFFNVALGGWKQEKLRKKRVKIFPAILDVIFTSLLIYFTGGPNSPWSLLYVFPIVSVSRYLGYVGSVFLAFLAIVGYATVILVLAYPSSNELAPIQNVDFYSLTLKCLILLGIAFVAGNLTTIKLIDEEEPDKEAGLLEIFREIDNESLKDAEPDEAIKLILEKVVKFHEADIGEIRIYDDEKRLVKAQFYDYTVLKIQEGVEYFNDKFYAKVLETKKRLTVYKMESEKLRDKYFMIPLYKFLVPRFPQLREMLEKTDNIGGFFFFVPIVLKDQVKAIIALSYVRTFHHSRIKTLKYYAPFIGMALKNNDLFQESSKIEKEKETELNTLTAQFFELKTRYQALVENSPDPIIVIDAEGYVKVFNKACEKIWGFEENEVIDTLVTRYYASEEHAKEVGRLLRKSPKHRVKDYLTSIKTKDGDIIPISLSASDLIDNEQKVASIGVFKDQRETIKLLTEKMTAETLATLNKFGHSVGHDIKTDLAVARLYINRLTDGYLDIKDEREFKIICQDLKSAIDEALSKITNTLEFQPFDPTRTIEPVSARKIIRTIGESARFTAKSAKIKFEVTSLNKDHLLKVDIADIKKVFFNLLHNSIDAIKSKEYTEEEKPYIKLSAKAHDGNLLIIWQDNGCGIPSKNIETIFLPFVTYEKQMGNGLGLYMVKDIIKNYTGDIYVESEVGVKTIFSIRLPIHNVIKRNISSGENT